MIMYLDTLSSASHGSRKSPLPEYKCNRRLKFNELLTLSSDELVPSPTKVEQQEITTCSGHLLKHPFFTHMTKNAVFPIFTLDKTTSVPRGCLPQSANPCHAEWPNRPKSLKYREKPRGGRWIHEVWKSEDCPQISDNNWIEWQEVRKNLSLQDGHYYPTPPKLNTPNDSRPNPQVMSARQMEVLNNIQKEQWLTTYTKEFTGFGPLGVMNLDNWQLKRDKYLQNGNFTDELSPKSKPRFDPTKSTFLSYTKLKPSASLNENVSTPLKRSSTVINMQEMSFQPELHWTPQYRSYEPLSPITKPDYAAHLSPNSSNEFADPSQANSYMMNTDFYDSYNQQLYDIDNSHSRNVHHYPSEFVLHSSAEETNPNENFTSSVKQQNIGRHSSPTLNAVPKMKRVNLLQLKRLFHRSSVREQFLDTFPDRNTDLRDHIETGKRHFPLQLH
jgi:hypothetical protein